MFNSLDIQCLFQAPDYHPIFFAKDCISGCALGISPILKMFHCVFVDKTIIRQTLPSNSSTTKTDISRTWGNPRWRVLNIERDIFDADNSRWRTKFATRVLIFNRPRSMVAVPLEES